jgi:hypothetical protein
MLKYQIEWFVHFNHTEYYIIDQLKIATLYTYIDFSNPSHLF